MGESIVSSTTKVYSIVLQFCNVLTTLATENYFWPIATCYIDIDCILMID